MLQLVVVSVGVIFVNVPIIVVVGSGASVSFDGAPMVGSGVVILIILIVFLLVVVFLEGLCRHWFCCCC